MKNGLFIPVITGLFNSVLTTVVNERFTLGEDQDIACEPIETWEIPDGSDPQAFKDELLLDNFTPQELEHREKIIDTISKMSNNPWLRLLMRVVRFVQGTRQR